MGKPHHNTRNKANILSVKSHDLTLSVLVWMKVMRREQELSVENCMSTVTTTTTKNRKKNVFVKETVGC